MKILQEAISLTMILEGLGYIRANQLALTTFIFLEPLWKKPDFILSCTRETPLPMN